MELKLTRPLVFLDLEATGKDPAVDKITEVAIVKLHTDGRREAFQSLVNPGRLLSDEIVELTGIRNEDLMLAPVFGSIAKDVHSMIDGCDLAGFGVEAFDTVLLWEELYREGIEWSLDGVRTIDSLNIYKNRERRNLAAARMFYAGKSHEGAHRAMADVQASMDVLEGQLAKYPDLPRDIDGLTEEGTYRKNRVDLAGKIELNAEGVPVFTFGAHQGKPVKSRIDYAQWMIREKFAGNTKMHLRRIIGDFTHKAMQAAASGAARAEDEPSLI